MSAQFKFSTYNVLSSELSSPAIHSACDPKWLLPSTRLNGICSKLNNETSEKAIVAIQELSLDWAGYLHTYFASKGYHFITALYSTVQREGYMGVGLSIPLDRFEVLDVRIKRISDTKLQIVEQNKSFLNKVVNKIMSFVLSIAEFFHLYSPKPDIWHEVHRRYNRMILARLCCKITKKQFVVGTYHMPNAFRIPPVLVVHSALAAQFIQSFAKDDPYVYMGDFNIRPDTIAYDNLTKGLINEKNEDYPPIKEGDPWRPVVNPMQSAYVTVNNQEPDCTTFAQCYDRPLFIGTLDYIFHSFQWKVLKVSPLLHRKDCDGPFPNEQEPSDHVMLSATMVLED